MRPSVMPETFHKITDTGYESALDEGEIKKMQAKLKAEEEEDEIYTDKAIPVDVGIEIIDIITELQRTRPDLLK